MQSIVLDPPAAAPRPEGKARRGKAPLPPPAAAGLRNGGSPPVPFLRARRGACGAGEGALPKNRRVPPRPPRRKGGRAGPDPPATAAAALCAGDGGAGGKMREEGEGRGRECTRLHAGGPRTRHPKCYDCRPPHAPVSYTTEELCHIWQKAAPPPPPWDRNEWRIDAFHALMKWSMHDRRKEYGWEVDHIVPPSKGGGGDMRNLRPMHWINSGALQDW